MITDDVRHEVAAKMLEICRDNPDVSLQSMVASAMNECLPDGMEYGPTLAELVFIETYGREAWCEEVTRLGRQL